MKQGVHVRFAEKKDILKIYQLGKSTSELSFSKKFPFHERGELREFIGNKKENIFLVAEHGEVIVGFIFAKIIAYGSGGWCMLDNLAVDKRFRNQGIGSLLLDETYKQTRKKGVNYVQVLVEESHRNTRKFWKSKGFKETKTFIWAERTI